MVVHPRRGVVAVAVAQRGGRRHVASAWVVVMVPERPCRWALRQRTSGVVAARAAVHMRAAVDVVMVVRGCVPARVAGDRSCRCCSPVRGGGVMIMVVVRSDIAAVRAVVVVLSQARGEAPRGGVGALGVVGVVVRVLVAVVVARRGVVVQRPPSDPSRQRLSLIIAAAGSGARAVGAVVAVVRVAARGLELGEDRGARDFVLPAVGVVASQRVLRVVRRVDAAGVSDVVGPVAAVLVVVRGVVVRSDDGVCVAGVCVVAAGVAAVVVVVWARVCRLIRRGVGAWRRAGKGLRGALTLRMHLLPVARVVELGTARPSLRLDPLHPRAQIRDAATATTAPATRLGPLLLLLLLLLRLARAAALVAAVAPRPQILRGPRALRDAARLQHRGRLRPRRALRVRGLLGGALLPARGDGGGRFVALLRHVVAVVGEYAAVPAPRADAGAGAAAAAAAVAGSCAAAAGGAVAGRERAGEIEHHCEDAREHDEDDSHETAVRRGAARAHHGAQVHVASAVLCEQTCVVVTVVWSRAAARRYVKENRMVNDRQHARQGTRTIRDSADDAGVAVERSVVFRVAETLPETDKSQDSFAQEKSSNHQQEKRYRDMCIVASLKSRATCLGANSSCRVS